MNDLTDLSGVSLTDLSADPAVDALVARVTSEVPAFAVSSFNSYI